MRIEVKKYEDDVVIESDKYYLTIKKSEARELLRQLESALSDIPEEEECRHYFFHLMKECTWMCSKCGKDVSEINKIP